MVNRIFTEKLPEFDSGTKKLLNDIENVLKIIPTSFRKLLRYDVDGLSNEYWEKSKTTVFSEPPVDRTFCELTIGNGEKMLISEYLTGQYDQRADSAAQCVQLLTGGIRPLVKCATVYIIGGVSKEEYEKIAAFLINPVDSKVGTEVLPETLRYIANSTKTMRVETPIITLNEVQLKDFYDKFGFAMTFADLCFVQNYFKGLKREPTLTELKVIDTYWSDHCRHTTFLTKFRSVEILSDDPNIEKAYQKYVKSFQAQYTDRSDKYPCLMDVATLAVKVLRRNGYLKALDESEEINACSVVVTVDNDGKDEDWLIMFKNETHNHPTEIEPFGGAATCLGGAIRDPLSGRAYVYQAMRITGAGNPLEDIDKTLKGKLPQRMLTKTALSGFSSYGNQIGLATGIVREIYNDNYKAKRLETGYVIGGVPKANVVRQRPKAGDLIILVGGDTGRDGCGGATGSSKAHTAKSVDLCGAEVQKGNPPEERKLQRLFRNPEVSKIILRCNDFGAGGVCVAIGELSDGLDIHLEKVSKKYDGLTATEIAISESQERMAVVVASENADRFISLSAEENLKATVVAEVTDKNHLRMFFNEEPIVDIERVFLDTNGVQIEQDITIQQSKIDYFNVVPTEIANCVENNDYEKAILRTLSSLKYCSQKGAGETFDSTIGAASVLMPFGGKNQLTPTLCMAAKPPVSGYTSTITCSSYGVYSELLSASPYLGSIYSIVGAVAKLVASGVKFDTIYLTLQEFFKRLNVDKVRWGEPLQALLGAFDAQTELCIGAIGGKDSMSGTFENIDVPPTLIAFAMGITKENNIVNNVFNKGYVHILRLSKDNYGRPDFPNLKENLRLTEKLISDKKVTSATVTEGSLAATLCKSLLGNGVGIKIHHLDSDFFKNNIGDILLVFPEKQTDLEYIGELNTSGRFTSDNINLSFTDMKKAFCDTLETVFPTTASSSGRVEASSYISTKQYKGPSIASPRVFIPVFPGTNCEYDTAKAFERAGAKTDIFVIKNRTPEDITQSIEAMKKLIDNAQIIAFPGGFSGGDEPDGSGKFIATCFKNSILKESIENLLYRRDGLALGICNGFQALIKLGLLPYGIISDMDKKSPTLTYNNIARHISTISHIRIGSNASPWLNSFSVGDVFSVPVSHGEGKLICPEKTLDNLLKNGQVATQYVDNNGKVTMTSPYNPNGSICGIEGLISPDGKVFGKMGHSERWQDGLYQNVADNYFMNIFANGIKYFS